MTGTKRANANFTAKLLAPLPADVEQVASDAFRKTLKADKRREAKASYNALYDAWHHNQCVLKLEIHRKSVKLYSWIVAGRPSGGSCDDAEFAAVCAAERELMLTASPGKTQLAWKRAKLERYAEDGEVLAAFAADEVRVAPKQEA